MLSKEDSIKFYEFFKGSRSAYIQQNAEGKSYTSFKEPLTIEDILEHLAGEKTIGIYFMSSGSDVTNFLALDIDKPGKEIAQAFIAACFKVGLSKNNFLVEPSGKKGWHIWIRFENPVLAIKAIRLGQLLVLLSGYGKEKIEINPKQRHLPENSFGNGLKLPLGIHQATQTKTYFVSPDTLEPLPDNVFLQVVPFSETELDVILSEFDRELEEYLEEYGDTTLPVIHEKKSASSKTQTEYKCIENIMAGVEEGKRNDCLFNLALYFLKEKRLPKQAALDLLLSWNTKNKPPLSEREVLYEVERIDQSEYEHFSCRMLKEFCEPNCAREKSREAKTEKRLSQSFIQAEKFLAEMIFDEESGARFVKYDRITGEIEIVDHVIHRNKKIYPFDDEVAGKVVFLPSSVTEYGTNRQLLEDLRKHIHKYLELDPILETLCAYYIMFSYIVDCFDICAYLRFHGDYGTGKSRALLAIGSVCYKPVMCSGATTASPIFRLMNKYHGTLIMDEADFQHSDATDEIIKIFNQGFMKNNYVLRCKDKGYETEAFDAYGTKILANRGAWNDKSLESRCITIEMRGRTRQDIPINIDLDAFYKESLEIRNKLTLWRFRNFGKKRINEAFRLPNVEDRINQIMLPLASIIEDEMIMAEYAGLIMGMQKRIVSDRTLSFEYNIALAIVSLFKNRPLSIKEITAQANLELDSQDKIRNSLVGKIMKNKFGFEAQHTNKGNAINITEEDVKYLQTRYAIEQPVKE